MVDGGIVSLPVNCMQAHISIHAVLLSMYCLVAPASTSPRPSQTKPKVMQYGEHISASGQCDIPCFECM